MGYFNNPSGSNVLYIYIYVENIGLHIDVKIFSS